MHYLYSPNALWEIDTKREYIFVKGLWFIYDFL